MNITGFSTSTCITIYEYPDPPKIITTSTSNCETFYTLISSSTNPISVINGFTYGEMIITLFLFMIFLTLILSLFIVKFMGIKFKKSVDY